MPIYEYVCGKCHAKFDHLARSMNAPASVECPECGSKKTEKAFSVFAVGAESQSPSAGGACDMNGGCGGCCGDGACDMD